MKYVIRISICTLLLLMTGCDWNGFNPSGKEITIGFSQLTSDDIWRQTMNEEMKRFASLHPDMKLEIRDASYSNDKQIEDIEYFISKNVDVLIVSPNEAKPITPVVEKAWEAGIPVVLVDRKINSDAYTAYIGADNYEIGKRAGYYAQYRLGGKGTVLEIHGAKKSSPAKERHLGFVNELAGSDIKVIDAGDGGWVSEPAYNHIYQSLRNHPDIDLIYAHNDVMGAAAYQAAKDLGRANEIVFVGIDALAKKTGGVEMILDGMLDASFLYPTGGKTAIETALKIVEGEKVPKYITLETALIDASNAEIYLQERNRINEQQLILEQQQLAIDDQILKFENQRYLLIVIGLLLLGALVILLFLYRAYGYIGQINQELNDNNVQLNHLLKTNNEINAIIGHDLRGPLTSILGLGEIVYAKISETKLQDKEEVEYMLKLLIQSASSMSLLIDDLFNWSRIQTGNLKVKSDWFLLLQEVEKIQDLFTPLIQSKGLKLYVCIEDTSAIYADRNIVLTIIRNFISNAIKFSNPGDIIELSLSEVKGNWKISVKDTGTGMSDEVKNRLFDSEHHPSIEGTANESGTGLGLRLSKTMAELQGGKLSIESTVGEGSIFSLLIPVKEKHVELVKVPLGNSNTRKSSKKRSFTPLNKIYN